MKFYKFRRQWSSSPGTWEYIRLPEGETPKSFFDEMAREYDWSEHFRGIEFVKVKSPPAVWLKTEISDMKRHATGLKKLAALYQEILNQL